MDHCSIWYNLCPSDRELFIVHHDDDHHWYSQAHTKRRGRCGEEICFNFLEVTIVVGQSRPWPVGIWMTTPLYPVYRTCDHMATSSGGIPLYLVISGVWEGLLFFYCISSGARSDPKDLRLSLFSLRFFHSFLLMSSCVSFDSATTFLLLMWKEWEGLKDFVSDVKTNIFCRSVFLSSSLFWISRFL